MTPKLRLGVNIDHVATVRNARGGDHPCPVRAAELAREAGADGITAHLREDRRHIKDHDIERLKNEIPLPLNLEMAMTEEMLGIALRVKPHAVCLVPERREEVTTEGGLDAIRFAAQLRPYVQKLQHGGSRVSLFIDAQPEQLRAAQAIGAQVVELHTGRYCHLPGKARADELARLCECAMLGRALGLEVHAGHGLNFDNVGHVAAIPEITELNIGHFFIGEAIFIGLDAAIRKMRSLMHASRITDHESRA
jgi:pyridoxine 5-phosphate synthase